MKLSVIIPMYNEKNIIGGTIETLTAYMSSRFGETTVPRRLPPATTLRSGLLIIRKTTVRATPSAKGLPPPLARS